MADGRALADAFQGVVFDLDGVVYLGDQVVPAAPGALDQVRGLGVRIAFVTNNSYRPPDLVVERLNRLGVKAATGEVLTSAQATVRLLGGRDRLVPEVDDPVQVEHDPPEPRRERPALSHGRPAAPGPPVPRSPGAAGTTSSPR